MPVPVIIVLAAFGAVLILVAALSAFLARFLVFPPRLSFEETFEEEKKKNYIRDYDRTKNTLYEVESFDGYVLHAELIRADKPSDRYVILSHGYSYDRHGSIKYTHIFRELGFNCIIYDTRGNGLNKKAPCSFGIKESRDLRAVIGDACRRFGGDIVIGLHGESMGSAISALCLPDSPDVTFAVLDCGFADFRSVIEGKVKSFHLPKTMILPVELMCRLLYKVSIFASVPSQALAQTDVPLCLIHGKKDTLIPYQHTEKNASAARGYHEEHYFPRAEHAMSFLSDEERYNNIIRDFVSKTLDR